MLFTNILIYSKMSGFNITMLTNRESTYISKNNLLTQ